MKPKKTPAKLIDHCNLKSCRCFKLLLRLEARGDDLIPKLLKPQQILEYQVYKELVKLEGCKIYHGGGSRFNLVDAEDYQLVLECRYVQVNSEILNFLDFVRDFLSKAENSILYIVNTSFYNILLLTGLPKEEYEHIITLDQIKDRLSLLSRDLRVIQYEFRPKY